jgi:hypothetical protein
MTLSNKRRGGSNVYEGGKKLMRLISKQRGRKNVLFNYRIGTLLTRLERLKGYLEI